VFSYLFTPWSRQTNVHPQVTLNGSIIPLDITPRYLGSDMDVLFTSAKNAGSAKTKASKGYQVIKALSGTSWGKNKETLIATYKALVRPSLEFNAPIWYPNASPTSIKKLQITQNNALRLITGCHKKSSIDHLHQETKILKVKNHLDLICSQFLARTLSPSHCSHDLMQLDPGPRLMKHMLRTKFIDAVHPFTNDDGLILKSSYKKVKESLHTAAVAAAIAELEPNKVLRCRPPPIADDEKFLPRISQTLLSQLRSDYCIKLRLNLYSIRGNLMRSNFFFFKVRTMDYSGRPNSPTHYPKISVLGTIYNIIRLAKNHVCRSFDLKKKHSSDLTLIQLIAKKIRLSLNDNKITNKSK
jgi:hypothetical protein